MVWADGCEMPGRQAGLSSVLTGTSKPVTKQEKREYFPQRIKSHGSLQWMKESTLFFIKPEQRDFDCFTPYL